MYIYQYAGILIVFPLWLPSYASPKPTVTSLQNFLSTIHRHSV